MPAAAAALGLAAGLLVGQGSATAQDGPIALGSDGKRTDLESRTGTPLYGHQFGHVSDAAPVVQKITNIEGDDRVPWAAVTSGKYDAALLKWANAVKAYPSNVIMSFNHEPETTANQVLGTADDFIAAWRHVHDFFAAHDVTNTTWDLTMTAGPYHVKTTDRRYWAKWYPGDAYVDSIGVDAYNWYGCHTGTKHPIWKEVSTIAGPALETARNLGKKFSLPEFGSNVDSADAARKARWLGNVHSWVAANSADFVGIWYFNKYTRSGACHWIIDSADQVTAYKAIINDPMFDTP